MSPLITPAEQRTLAAGLIGSPWSLGADGPDAFSCWGLVRYWFRVVHGLNLPDVQIASGADQAPAIYAAVGEGGWGRADLAEPAEHDVALLRNPGNGGRHIGVLVLNGAGLHLLHCEGSTTNPRPGVLCEPLADVLNRYHAPQLWRRTE